MEDNIASSVPAPGSLLAAALRYAERGWYVFPAFVVWNAETRAKESRFPDAWPSISTTDPAMITAWFGPGGLYHERGHLCIDTGKSGLVVVDCDGAAGMAEWESLRAMRRDCPETYRTATPGGGQHWYYRARPGETVTNSTSKLAPGVDVRGAGGLVYAPPSADARGLYRWLEGEPELLDGIPFVPRSVIEATAPAREYAKAPALAAPVIPGLASAPRIFTPGQAQAFLAPKYAEFWGLRSGIDHGYNAALFELAQMVDHFVPAFYSHDGALAWLLDACKHNGMLGWPGEDPEKTIRRAWREYPADWRAVMPPDPAEVIAGEPMGSHSQPGAEIVPAPAGGLVLPGSFWDSRPGLAHIRDAAYARMGSADVALHVVLARLAGMHPHAERLDTGIGGGPMVLNYFVALAGHSSAGKSSSAELAQNILPGPPAGSGTGFSDGLPIGSGEGLAEAFMGVVEVEQEPGPTGRAKAPKKVRKQVRHNAFVYVDEGEQIVRLMERSGATIGEALRRAWSGATLGQQNGTDDTTRVIPRGSYALGMAIGFQPEFTWQLLRDTAGTPQRFVWVWATDPSVPLDGPGDPGVLPWAPRRKEAQSNPLAGLGGVQGTWSGEDWREPDPMTLDPEIKRGIRERAWQARTGVTGDPGLDGKRDETCVRIAALLALLDGRGQVGHEDWELAGVVWETSCRVRDHLVALGRAASAQESAGRAKSAAVMAGAAEEARLTVHEARAMDLVTRGRAWLIEKVGKAPGIARRDLGHAVTRTLRPVWREALGELLAAGALVERDGGIWPAG